MASEFEADRHDMRYGRFWPTAEITKAQVNDSFRSSRSHLLAIADREHRSNQIL
jgi:hypothetical protein